MSLKDQAALDKSREQIRESVIDFQLFAEDIVWAVDQLCRIIDSTSHADYSPDGIRLLEDIFYHLNQVLGETRASREKFDSDFPELPWRWSRELSLYQKR